MQTLSILFRSCGLSLSDLPRIADRQSADQFAHAQRPQLPRLLHHHLLRLRRALRQHDAIPGLLQSLFGYDATTSGLVLSPAGLFAVMVLLIVGMLLARGVDARYSDGRGPG